MEELFSPDSLRKITLVMVGYVGLFAVLFGCGEIAWRVFVSKQKRHWRDGRIIKF